MPLLVPTRSASIDAGQPLVPGLEYYSNTAMLGGADWSTNTYTTWTNIQNNAGSPLSFTYTPPIDSWLYVFLTVCMTSDTADSRAMVEVYNGATSSPSGYVLFSAAAKHSSGIALGRFWATEGTAYTINARFYLPNDGQTVTFIASPGGTYMTYWLESVF